MFHLKETLKKSPKYFVKGRLNIELLPWFNGFLKMFNIEGQ
jgi:hypothetical protein